MRWTALLLLLTACTTWTSYESGDELRPQVAAALREAHGRAALASGNRAYVIPHGATHVDLKGFLETLADEVENQRYPEFDRKSLTIIPDPDLEAVVSYPYPDRRLELVGPVTVQGTRSSDGYVYFVAVEPREREHIFITVVGTPSIARAWGRLLRGAQAAARPAAHAPKPFATMSDAGMGEVSIALGIIR